MEALFEREKIDRLQPKSVTWKKQHAVCLIIPTCGSAEVTAATIVGIFRLHKEPGFDVVIIDNGGTDFAPVCLTVKNATGKEVNGVLLEANLGSAGSQYLGVKMALERGYEVVVLCDNDAEMETPEGIHLLVGQLEQWDMVLPANKSRGHIPRILPYEVTFHYLALKSATALKLGFPDPFFFLNGDDVEYTMRAEKMGLTVMEIPQVSIRHWLLKPVLLSNQTRYFTIRNHLYLALRCRLRWPRRLRLLAFVGCYLTMELTHGVQFRDSSMFRAAVSGLLDFTRNRLNLSVKPSRFRYEWQIRPQTENDRVVDFRPLANRVFLKSAYSVPGLDSGEEVFERVSNN